MLKEAAAVALILKHTQVTRQHLTPELQLALITRASALWRATEDQLPFPDPYWGFYWPGGQGTARYILDNKSVVKGRSLLDVGCGCGASSIAAVKMGARRVVANDIDTYALVATKINADLNGVTVETSAENIIGSKCEEFDTILIGDLFYDEEFANKLFAWLQTLTEHRKTVLIGDPGRHGLTSQKRDQMTPLVNYHLPPDCCIENHGFNDTTVWKLN